MHSRDDEETASTTSKIINILTSNNLNGFIENFKGACELAAKYDPEGYKNGLYISDDVTAINNSPSSEGVPLVLISDGSLDDDIPEVVRPKKNNDDSIDADVPKNAAPRIYFEKKIKLPELLAKLNDEKTLELKV